jgi:serine/threonine protein kinase
MAFVPGTRLGPYEITGKIGEGGMGEVWRATDSRLGREVALELLPDDFATDRERHARFEREGRVLASLNHPNIATLYGLEHLEPGGRTATIPVTAGATSTAGKPRDLFPVRLQPMIVRHRWLASRDAQRFLLLEPEGTARSLPTTVVLNWAEALRPQ